MQRIVANKLKLNTPQHEMADRVFELFEDARQGHIGWKELAAAHIGKQESKLYLARELHFLSSISEVSGRAILAEMLNALHESLLKSH
jgi:hypothetical protein